MEEVDGVGGGGGEAGLEGDDGLGLRDRESVEELVVLEDLHVTRHQVPCTQTPPSTHIFTAAIKRLGSFANRGSSVSGRAGQRRCAPARAPPPSPSPPSRTRSPRCPRAPRTLTAAASPLSYIGQAATGSLGCNQDDVKPKDNPLPPSTSLAFATMARICSAFA